MIRTLAPVAALLFSVAILITGQGLQGTLLPVRANLEEFSALMVGIMGAAYFLGFTLGCVRGIDMIRKVGHIRVFAAMTAIASATPLLHGLFIHDVAWCIFRFLSGFCFAALYVVIESWLNEMSTNENRGMIFSVYVIIHLTVVALGQQMLLLADPAQMPLFAAITVLVSLAAVPVALSTSPMPQIVPEGVKVNFKKLYVISPAGVLGCVAAGIASGIFYSLSPLYTAAQSDDLTLAASFMTAAVLGGALGQWPLGYVSDRIDRRFVIAFCAVVCCALSVGLWLVSGQLSTNTLLVVNLIWGAMSFPIYSISIAHANDYAQPDDFVMISSGMLLVYGLGAVVGPFIGSAFIGMAGVGGMFLPIAIADAALALYILYRVFQREQADSDDQIPFTEALAAVVTKSPVYDYYEDEETDEQQAEPQTAHDEDSGADSETLP
ncbi:MAG: MFS transporter [Pseudomonadota bacterium]